MSDGGNPSELEDCLTRYRELSESQLLVLRATAEEIFGENDDFVVGVNGSLARREFTSGSDVDLFFLVVHGDVSVAQEMQNRYRGALASKGVKMPASGGVFECPLPASDLLGKIGGNDDTNIYTTRRMLFLLEGDWVFNQQKFEENRAALIARYVDEGLDDRKICLFLLNDIIRYWRTICVDYEFKTADDTKAKAVRLIKLRFSRMLLYFAGVIAIGQTQDKDCGQKRSVLNELLSLPPIERIRRILGEKSIPALMIYAEFLTALDDVAIRDQLEIVGEAGVHTDAYKRLSDRARTFKDELVQLLLTEMGIKNPVVKALLL